MVNICGKCKHRIRSETTQDGEFHHYCEKADELYGTEPEKLMGPDSAEPKRILTTLRVKFNDPACQYYEKKRRQ